MESVWRECLILCHCDNKAVVSQVNSLHARDLQASHLLCCLAYLQALFDCQLQAVRLLGYSHTGVDHLSLNTVVSFKRLHPLSSAPPHRFPQSGEPYHATDTQVDITSVEADLQRFLAAGVAESTMRAYKAVWASTRRSQPNQSRQRR